MGIKEVLKKQGLTDAQVDAILADMKANKIYTTSEENIDERYSKLKGQKEDADEQLKTANKTIEDLKKSNKDNETLQATITEHEKTIETLKTDSAAKIRNMAIDGAIEKALVTSNAKHHDLLSTKFDREKIKVSDDGKTIEGIDDQLKGLKETYKDLFGQSVEGNTPKNPETTPGVSGDTSYNQLLEGADTMTAEEIAAQFMKMNEK